MLIEKYTPTWIMDFADLKREIENGLFGLAFSIEHVGSTAVPNLASKPIIDIDIVYYGTYLIKSISTTFQPQMGSGFSVRQLERYRQFYRMFPNTSALRTQFKWTHY